MPGGSEPGPCSTATLQKRIAELEAELAAEKAASADRLDRCEQRLDGYDEAWSAMSGRRNTHPTASALRLVTTRDPRSHAG
jgi:siderophore synthetase component